MFRTGLSGRRISTLHRARAQERNHRIQGAAEGFHAGI